MENATKALLIAGSILIVILLIAFGMRILNPATQTIDTSQSAMQTTEMATFNSKFTSYVGTNKSRAQVMSLLNVIIANNATSNHSVTVNNGGSAQNMMNSGLVEKAYTITINKYEGGYVSDIQIN